jgi:hypothetical protein
LISEDSGYIRKWLLGSTANSHLVIVVFSLP